MMVNMGRVRQMATRFCFTQEAGMPDFDPRLIACRRCGAIMMKLSRDICQKCFMDEEEDFNKVKDYLRDHPGSSMKEVGCATGVAESLIEKFVSSGRLERMGVVVEHTCQTCHKQISSGIICPECKKDLKMHLQQLKEEVSRRLEPPKPKRDDSSDGGFHSGKSRRSE